LIGVGGNTIQFAKKFPLVFSVDISMERLLLAKHNAKIYEVSDNIDFIRADFTSLVSHWRVFLVSLMSF
jgi:trimethylguanosine synthase